MKPILATIALLLVSGCASKPKPTGQFVIWALPNNSGGVSVVFEDPVVHHVTREQWEAAQGLYNPKRVRGIKLSGTWGSGAVFTCAGCTASTDPGMLFSTSAGTTAPAHFKKAKLCPKGEHRALIDIPIQREGVACAGTAINDCAKHHVIDVCEKNHDPFGDTFPPAGDAK